MTLGTCWLAAFLAAVPAVLAQNAPHLAYVLPAGGQQGTTFQVTTGGQFLPNVSKVYVSGSGVHATVVDYVRPMNAMQAIQLRDRMQALQKQPMTAAVQKEMVDTRVKLLLFNARRLTSPVLAETVTLQVTIASDGAYCGGSYSGTVRLHPSSTGAPLEISNIAPSDPFTLEAGSTTQIVVTLHVPEGNSYDGPLGLDIYVGD